MRNIIFTLSALVITFNAIAQEPSVEVKKSTEKIIVNGKIFYLHIVQPGQTAYSISKAYGVTLQDITAENAGFIPGQLQPGQVIKIPVVTKAEPSDEDLLGLDKDDFIFHQVNKGENAYFLSRKYSLPLEVLYKFNPGTETGLQVNQIVKIPRKKVMKEVIENVRDYDNFYYYEVRKKDTLYTLSKNYGVAVADIIDNNPELRWGLKSGMTIKIPKISQYLADTTQLARDTLNEEVVSIFLSAKECDSVRLTNFNKSVNVAVMLPFFADFTSELKKATDDTSYISDDPNIAYSVKRNTTIKGDYYFEFYEGILMALDTLRKTGLNINLLVYDTEKDTVKVKKILNGLETKNPDLIIGPVFPEPFKMVAKFAGTYHINLVSPIYSRTNQLVGFPNAFQFIPSRETDYQAMASIVSSYPGSNLILVYDSDTTTKRDYYQLKNTLIGSYKDSAHYEQCAIKEILFSDTLYLNIKNSLAPDKKNLVIITSNNEAYVSELLSHLDRNQKSFDIIVIGQPSWLTFNNIDLEYFHNLELNVFAPFHIDYKNISTKRFLKQAIKILGYEPNELKSKGYNLTFLGYDIAFYFIEAFIGYGKDFQKCLCCIDSNTLLNQYNFIQKNPFDGFENTSMIYLKFNKDFTISRIKPDTLNHSFPGKN